jgi:hypothetical protein
MKLMAVLILLSMICAASARANYSVSDREAKNQGYKERGFLISEDPVEYQPEVATDIISSTLTLAWSTTESSVTNDAAWGDMDGDGDLDLAFGNSGANQVYINTTGG